ncbi:MAG: transposase [Pseudanabaenales cyanobacterium]|nr:transposase [Pseudanabaenales cyanobacterium]
MANTIEVGAYLITLHTYQQECLFGAIVDGVMQLNEIGQIAVDEWGRLSKKRQEIELDQWAIMPNHILAIVRVKTKVNLPESVSLVKQRHQGKPRSLSSFVAGFKAAAAKRINLVRNQPGLPVWQRSYQERLIRDEITLQRMRQIILNPSH